MASTRLTQEAARHLALVTPGGYLSDSGRHHLDQELSTAPLFSSLTHQIIETQHQKDQKIPKPNTSIYPQYGLLGLRVKDPSPTTNQTQSQIETSKR